MLDDVRPRLAAQDASYSGRVDTDTFGDLAMQQTFGTEPSYLTDGVVGESRRVVLFTLLRSAHEVTSSAFGRHVGEVIPLRADEEVVWSDAWRVVAAVAEVMTFWDWAFDKLPSYAMRSLPSSVNPRQSIASAVVSALPFPALA